MRKTAVLFTSIFPALLLAAGCSHGSIKTADAGRAAVPMAEADLNAVHFAFDKSALTAQAKANLDRDIAILKKDAQLKFQIQGFCDARGSVQYNLGLGQRRAAAVGAYLEKNGIDPGRVSVVSFGKSRPLDSGRSEAAYAVNRRASFAIAGDHDKVASR